MTDRREHFSCKVMTYVISLTVMFWNFKNSESFAALEEGKVLSETKYGLEETFSGNKILPSDKKRFRILGLLRPWKYRID